MFTLAAVLAPIGRAAYAADLATIRLTASSLYIKSDGRSTTTISAEVRDASGGIVPDGTQVRFAVTAGRLDTDLVATQNGVARAVLTAGDLPATAIVTANLEPSGRAAPEQIQIGFLADLDSGNSGSQWIRVQAKNYTAYAADHGIIEGEGKGSTARLSFRGVAISADAFQLTVASGMVVANGNVILSAGKSKVFYSHLRLNLMNGQGVAERVDDDGKTTVLFVDTQPTFQERPAPDESRGPVGYEGFKLADISDSGLTIQAKSIAMQPGKTIQFRNATFYIGGNKTASLPFHVMNVNQEELFAEQVIGYDDQGLTVDFPLYYDVEPGGIGALHIRRGSQVGSSAYSNQSGWSFDVDQSYNGQQNAQGTVEVRGLTRGDWGADIRHAQQFGTNLDGNFYVDFPNHENLFSTAQLTRRFKGYSINVDGSGSYTPSVTDSITGLRIASGGDLRGQLYGATDPRSLWRSRDVQYSFNVGTSRQDYFGVNAVSQNAIDTQYTTLRLTTRPMRIAYRMTVSQSVSLGQTWVSVSGKSTVGLPSSGQTVLGTTAFSYSLPKNGTLGITYDYTQTPLTNGFTTNSVGRHRLGMSLFMQPLRPVTFTLSGSRGLDVPNDNLSTEMDIAIGGPWRTRTKYSTSYFSGVGATRYSDVENGLFYRLGSHEFAVYYSTTARRFQFDMSGTRF